jgi:hypothetical protein
MKRLLVRLFLGFLFACSALLFSAIAPSETKVMLAAISRDGGLLSGGIGPYRKSKSGHAFVEPIAYLSESGKWESLPCGAGRDTKQPKGCELFGKEYLSKPHAYTVVSADGEGAVVNAMPTKLDECLDYTADGTYSGASITRSAIAASNPDLFSHVDAPILLQRDAAEPVYQALTALVPKRLDSAKRLKAISLRLNDQDLIVVKREFSDLPETENVGERRYIFAIGAMEGKRFRILHWKENSGDEVEGILGVIRLKSGREFLITSVSDPEGQWFRVYGLKDGRLALIISGGGSSC